MRERNPLAVARFARGLTQQELATRAEVAKNTVQRLEGGDMPTATRNASPPSSVTATVTIPAELRALPHVLWRYEPRPGDPKPTKVPFQPAFPWKKASSTDPSTWGDSERAEQMRHEADGVGVVLTAGDGIVGIDLDHAVDGNGEISPWAKEILEKLDSYTERSPSGTGFRVFVRGELRAKRHSIAVEEGEPDAKFEVYDRARFFTITGQRTGQRETIEERQDQLDAICERMFPAKPVQPSPAAGTGLADADDHELLGRARRAKNGVKFDALWRGEFNGHGSPSEADLAFCSLLAFWTRDPEQIDGLFRESGLMREKWERADYREETIARALNRSEFYEQRATQAPPEAAQRPSARSDGSVEEPQSEPSPYTDTGNAERFAAAHSHRLRYLRERHHFLVYQGGRWRRDTSGEAERAAKDVARSLLTEASQLGGEASKEAAKWGLKLQSEPRLRAQLTLAGSEREVVVSADDLDPDPYVLACGNGVLDLRTSELREPVPDDLITLGTDVPYEPAARCDRWLKFLDEVFGADEELIAFLKRFFGYLLTGDMREHVLAVFHGAGANGKSTLIGVLRRLLGDFAVTAAFDTFMRQRDRGPRNDLARLHRARLVTAAESGEGRKLDEATVKAITGGDVIAARFLYGEHFEFKPEFKLVLVTNHRPKVDGDDDAIWRRLRLIPFEQSFEGREDKALGEKLEAELPGILAWAVRGCLEWRAEGLGEAAAVTRATAEYRADEDVLGGFLAERCAMAGEVPKQELRAAYEAYCAELGEEPLRANVLGKRLAKRGVKSAKRGQAGQASVYKGVSLR